MNLYKSKVNARCRVVVNAKAWLSELIRKAFIAYPLRSDDKCYYFRYLYLLVVRGRSDKKLWWRCFDKSMRIVQKRSSMPRFVFIRVWSVARSIRAFQSTDTYPWIRSILELYPQYWVVFWYHNNCIRNVANLTTQSRSYTEVPISHSCFKLTAMVSLMELYRA